MSKDFYKILWVEKNATSDEIKKTYRKLAMKYHPDRNKGDLEAEKKFKEINEAYDTLSDDKKRKQYDMFWSNSNFWWTWGNPFSWWQTYTYNSNWWIDLEDLFWWFSSGWQTNWWFDFWDIFSSFWWQSRTRNSKAQQKEEVVDIEKTYEIPIFDLILWCKIEVSWYLWQKAKLKIPPNTKPWTKFRVKEFGKNIWWRKWNMIVIVDAKMPKNISDVDKNLLENIRDNITY